MFPFARWTSWSVRIPAHNSTVTVRRARVVQNPRYRRTLLLAAPLLVAAGIQASELLVPKEVRDHLNAIEKNWDDFKRKRTELDKQSSKNAQALELSRAAQGGKDKPPDFAPIWIPIPIWTTSRKAPEYKTTDPEWKEFLKLEQDQERVKKLKSEIARSIATSILDGLPPPVLRAWGFEGKVGYDSGRIDFVFPFSPPNIYQNPGVLITASGIEWTSQELPDERGRRFYRIFHPTVFAQAFWAGGKAFFKYHYSSVKTSLSDRFSERPKQTQTTTVSKVYKGFSVPEQARLKKALTISDPSTLQDRQNSAELLKLLIPPPAPESAVAAAVNAYKRKVTHMQVARWSECPRGGCYLTGYVDIHGTKATIRVSVKAIYIPSQETFLGSPTIGEAIVMPKLSMMAADKLRLEKIKAENELRLEKIKAENQKGDSEEQTALSGKQMVQEKVRALRAERLKQSQELKREHEKEGLGFEKEEPKREDAKAESQTNLEMATEETQKKIEIPTTENLKSLHDATEGPRDDEKSKTELRPATKSKEGEVKLDAAKQKPGQGPPDEK